MSSTISVEKPWPSKSTSISRLSASSAHWSASRHGAVIRTCFHRYYGPEFVALALAEWAERQGIALDFIEPGRPMQNGFIERFDGSYRRGVLDMHIFRTLSEVREQTEHWLADYNQQIPHDSVGGLTPTEFRDQHQPQTSNFSWH
ncbi:putative isxcc1 transposase orfb (fragment) protein [Xanthomonas albilineans GPE PC73]|uniref:Putative isxcc1 transposase orfb protein n=1 Tax=Xanthomonas albilineans (strain GPE PC73 / CFBP 7063) TaxID=380358 RepID=D2UC05_XANAP